MNLNKLLLLALFSFFFLFSGVRADIVGNLITNGDFESFDNTTMNLYDNSTVVGYSWSGVGGGDDCTTVNDRGNNICYISGNNCTYRNFTQHCLGMTPETGAKEIQSNPFTWTSNSSWGTITIFWKTNETTSAINLTFGLYDVSGVIPALTGGNTQNTFFCYDVNSALKVIKCTVNITYASLFSAPTVYTNSPLKQGTVYRLFLHRGTGDNFWLDNVTLFSTDNQLLPTSLFGSCEINYPNTTIGFLNVTQKCETSPIDTTNCVNITGIRGDFINNYYGGWADCNGKSETFTYAFNTSFNTIIRQPSCVSQIATLYDTYSNGNTNPYFNNTNAFSTCYYPYANVNLTLERMFCFLSLSCFLNTSSLGQSCNSICTGNYLKENGTFDTSLNTCVGFTKISHCAVGCGSLTSCGATNMYNGSDFRQSIFGNINGTGSNNPSLFNIMGSTLFIILLLIIVIIGLLYEVLPNQHLTIMVYSILVAIFTIIGYIPTWLGLSLCIMGIGLTVLLSKR